MTDEQQKERWQQRKSESYTTAAIASRAVTDAAAECWTAHGDMVEYQQPNMHWRRALALIDSAREEITQEMQRVMSDQTRQAEGVFYTIHSTPVQP